MSATNSVRNCSTPTTHISWSCAPQTTPPIDPSAEARALMAIMALHAEGNKKKQAQNAVKAYFIYRGR